MAVTANFRISTGLVTTRQLNPGVGVSIYGKCTGVTGMPEPGTHVQINITKPGGEVVYSQDTITNLWGDYDFWFRTPNSNTKLNVRIVATYSIAGQDIVNIPIGVGSAIPDPLPTPTGENTWLNLLPPLLISAGALLLYKEIKRK